LFMYNPASEAATFELNAQRMNQHLNWCSSQNLLSVTLVSERETKIQIAVVSNCAEAETSA